MIASTFADTIEVVGKTLDAVGVAAIAIGLAYATGRAALDVSTERAAVHGDGDVSAGHDDVFRRYRRRLGRAILLGLEILVAADIVRTVAVSPTFRNAGVLAVIVAIRTVLSLSLEVELEGRWPWERRRASD